ncbi:MAG: hypothetical protein KGI78_02850 [Patescibacteria group bacterium]|nr:hypothetical protein [Patescibacteria group bacterium]MDE1944626.1 hypothetical protein [Patescibacteria group bacterium]MDE1945403.1 hypothetical protein [Patescibacteria group bacterium]MDE2057768.1 hypothetical protein [Patescibacteria group bacterium]
MSEPLAPFHPPAALAARLAVSPGALAAWLLLFVLALWAIYTAIAVYHWIRFSHAARVAYPAIALHLLVSASLVLFMLTGL